MSDRIKVYHFHNGSGGGVLSVIRNLLFYKQHLNIENHVIYTINFEKQKTYSAPGLKGATSEQVFYYSPNNNFYYTCKQLAKLVPDDQCVLVAHDWLELGMVSNLGLQNPVVQFLHGHYDYYFNLAKKHEQWVDCFICVAYAIHEKLTNVLPQRKANNFYNRFPVPDVQCKLINGSIKKILFLGRCEHGKGYQLLPQIADQLTQKGYFLEWHIFGEGSLEKENQIIWPANANVFFYGTKTNTEVLELMPNFDCMILPSLAEGMPIAIIEAMKAGVIPIVNDLSGGLQEIVLNGETGYRIQNNNVDAYVETFIQLKENEQIAIKVAIKASRIANEWFNPIANTSAIETVFLNADKTKHLKNKQKIYGSRLDAEWMPNGITSLLRKISLK